MANHVAARGLVKQFHTRDGRLVRAVDQVSLAVPQGQFLAVMGPSGSGKTTLLHLLAGLSRPDEGTVTVGDTDLGSLGDRRLTLFRRRNIGVVFQAFNLIPTLTAGENIMLPILAGEDVPDRRLLEESLDRLVQELQLSDRRDQFPETLSGGEQQRVAIARALLPDALHRNQSSLLLADEPTGNLDSLNSEAICRILRRLCDENNHTTIVVTHEPAVAEYADRIVTLKDGRITGDSRPADLG